jgi:hypothetical protein
MFRIRRQMRWSTRCSRRRAITGVGTRTSSWTGMTRSESVGLVLGDIKVGLLTLFLFIVVLVFVFDMEHLLEESLHFGSRSFEGFGRFTEMSTDAVT